ncbi:hypothetical protein SDC9_47874 [bioreactor metagenome]|jgi:uncharacterized protein
MGKKVRKYFLNNDIIIFRERVSSMEIGRINRKAPVKQDTKVISEKRDFSQSFNQARERKSEEQLKEMIENIHKKGNRLVITKTYGDVIAYKKLIKEYLESILKFMYDTKKDISFWQTQYFITIDTIDQKLEDLTKSLLNGEGENLNIASSIDEIQGLIVDIYR